MEWPEPEYEVSEAKDDRGKMEGRMGFSAKSQICHWVVGGSGVNWQLPLRSPRLKPMDTIWMECPEPKDGII